jgi:cytochrome c peroxidase
MGGTINNGTSSAPPGIVVPNFHFEPEFPLASLKTVPIWFELEQLLDNPYNVALCSALPATVDPLVRNTPGTTVITGSPNVPVYPAYCTTSAVVRRPGFGVTLPPLLMHPLNYNATTGEEMRLINPTYPGGKWIAPDELVQRTANLWTWDYKNVQITPGSGRVTEAEIDNNGPIRADIANNNAAALTFAAAAGSGTSLGLAAATGLLNIPALGGHCIVTLETFPAPEGDTTCGGDPGEPGGSLLGVRVLPVFGVNNPSAYSRPAVPGVASPATPLAGAATGGPITARLFDQTRGGSIPPRTGAAGGLRKPSLRVSPYGTPTAPGYLVNQNANNVAPSNENDYVRARNVAAALGKAFFWDMQVGSDAIQSCGSCHAHAGADSRVKNQLNPNHLGGDLTFEVEPPNGTLVATDFPFQKLFNPDIAGDPKCTSVITASLNAGVLENNLPAGGSRTVCSAGNVIPDRNNAMGTKTANDVASSMGVHFGRFADIPTPGASSFGPASAIGGVKSVLPDLRSTVTAENTDPIPGFQGSDGTGHGIRRVEPRNTPTIFAAALNFDNFWDGRANHDFNGGSVFGSSDPQKHVFVNNAGALTPTRQIIRFSSLASLATGPGLSEFEMSFLGRNWAKIGKKLLQPGVTPLANQLVSPTDSLLGPYSNQPGNPSPSPLCSAAALASREVGKPGLCASYSSLIQAAFYPALHNNSTAHLNGCYTDGNVTLHPNQCTAASGTVPILNAAGTAVDTSNFADPFDGYKLMPAAGAAVAADTNQFTQMEGNFSLFWGLAIQIWAELLMPDDTPFDKFMDQNPDAFEAIGEAGETGLVGPVPLCTSATQRDCVREVGNFKRDNNLNCGAIGVTPCAGTRVPGAAVPDPLLGMDIFQGSNLSLKNPNFRAARCGECHAGGTFTDNTVPFTTKAQLGDFIGEFIDAGNEALIEPLGRTRVISGFLAEDELNGNGQDAIERRIANQSIVPCATDGLAYPGGLEPGSGQGFGPCSGAAQSFFDNGVYNLGVTRCDANQSGLTGYCDDDGRGAKDAFGWPLSHAAKLMKNLGGPAQQPGTPLPTFDPSARPDCAPPGAGGCADGGLFEETAQDEEINPGFEGEPVNPLLPPYMAPWMNQINVGDAHPDMDEADGGLNTLTDLGSIEGFTDTLGPFNPAGVVNEAMNNADSTFLGTWPVVNRVGRFGSMKAAQLREVELTGPYFHNGGKLTLRQVVDFYTRGGDFPITNAGHRDFNIINLNIEVESNLTEDEKVALVDFLLELTDDRVKFERAPFDHPEVILPLDGTAPENLAGRDAMLTGCAPFTDPKLGGGPGRQSCAGNMFLDVPAVGAAGNPSTSPLPNFLGISSGPRLVGSAATCATTDNHYCH